MSIYSDVKEAIKLLEDMKDMKSKVSKLEEETMKLRERVAYLEAREDAIVLTAKEAVRKTIKELNSGASTSAINESS